MIKRLALIGLAAATVASAAVKFPYPQAHDYPYTKVIADNWNCAGETASSMLKKQFEIYLQNYYEEQGDLARIKFDDKARTVSEGIGYGMLMCVYFSDNTTSYQSHFDKLWKYYKKFMNGNGIMNWNINGFNGVIGTGGATDAEEDVAVALIMAYYQFGNESYKNDAATLIANMRKSEFSSNGMHKLGDQWDPYKNPSYVSPAAYELFKDVDAGNSSFWSSAITTNYNMLLKNRNSSTGIPSGWADNNSFAPIVGNNGYNFAGYDYDAVRAPWRWAWSYAWYGHEQAKDLSSKLAAWVASKPFGQLYINMKTDGTANLSQEPCKTNGCKANGSSIGSLSSVLMVDEKYTDLMKNNYGVLMSQQQGYFHSSLRLLTGLLMSGNMQNFAKATPVQPQQFVIPEDACKDTTTYFENSGAFGWNSTSVELSNESNTGVHMGKLIRGDAREAYRKIEPVEAGKSYVLSFDGTQSEGSNLWLTYAVYSDSTVQDKLCGAMKKLSANQAVNYTCEFTAKESGSVYLALVLNSWDDPQLDISNLALKSATGEDVDIKEEESSIGVNAMTAPEMKVSVSEKIAYVQLSSAARVSVMDMQGRVVVPAMNVDAGMTQVQLSGLNAGNYLVVVKQRSGMKVKQIHIAD